MKKVIKNLIFIILFSIIPHCYATENSIDLYFNYPFYQIPSTKIRTDSAQILFEELKSENTSLDFMIYGIYKQPQIYNQITRICNNPKIKLKGIVDINDERNNDYPDTIKLTNKCKYIKFDYSNKNQPPKYYEQQKNLRYLMHNKVFVFSNNHVWTGSTNISSTGTGGYNSNVTYLIKDEQIANIYRNEIDYMYDKEKFHTQKIPHQYTNLKLRDGSIVDVYFSPNDKILTDAIIPSLKNAKESIDIAMFYLTNKTIIEEIINAQKRGIRIRLILDASFAGNYRYLVDRMRSCGIQLKIENWAGKMHNKFAIIDNKQILTGSLNWTYSAIKYNDENFLVIKNKKIATQHTEYFDTLWNSIPNKWLYKIPRAESIDSPYSCDDGIDNDNNGHIDQKDYKCKYKK